MSEFGSATAALTRPLQLAVDARDLARDDRGIGTYARALLTIFAQRDDVRLTLLVRGPLPWRMSRTLRFVIGAPQRTAMRCRNAVPAGTDVLWHPWNGTFFTGSAAAVATIHDVAAFAFPAADARRRKSEQAPIERTAATATAILCDSHFTASEVNRYLGVPPERLHTVPLGVDPVFCPGPIDALPAQLRGRRFVLYVGAHDAHKNVPTLIAAHRAAFPSGDVALVFTRPNPLAPEAIVCNGVTTATLVALYRAAALVAVPSLYEGFGLPVLEALACGTPVVASRAASLPEVGGEVAAYVEEPLDPTVWRSALRELYANVEWRARAGRDGPRRAACFRWEDCAERTLRVLRSTASASRRRLT